MTADHLRHEHIERFALAMEAMNDGVWDWNVTSNKTVFSDSYYTMAGYEPGAFPPTFESWSERLHPDDRNRAIGAVQDYTEGRRPNYRVAFRWRRADNDYMWILARGKIVARTDDGGPRRLVGTHTDITELILAQEALRTNEANLRITLNSIGDGVLATDARGRVIRANPTVANLLGRDIDSLLNQNLDDILHLRRDDQPVEHLYRAIVEVGRIASRDQIFQLDGTGDCPRLVTCDGTPILTENGEVHGAVLVLRDVTDRESRDSQLRHSQKMESIGQLAGGVAHDFNNMLAGITGAAELLSFEDLATTQQREYVELILQSAHRAGGLTEKLLAFSRKGKVLSKPIDLHTSAANAIAIIRRSFDRRIDIDVDLAARATAVVGDPVLLENAVLNLCINARDAMPDGGRLEITTANVDLEPAYCTTSPFDLEPGPHIQVSVRDTGIGMTSEVQAHAFDPFYTTKEVGRGTGLGLAAVYGTVLDHRGAIQVYSEVGEGTVFHLLFAVTDHVAEANAPAVAPQSGTGRILIIDDEDVIRTTATHMLGSLGYEVAQAKDGVEGLAVFERDGADLVVLDMVMPNMNGEECFRRLREIAPDLPVLLSSGFARDQSVAMLMEQGLDGFVKKPYRLHELAAAVAAAMR